MKQSSFQRWRRRYFRLQGARLSYSKEPKVSHPIVNKTKKNRPSMPNLISHRLPARNSIPNIFGIIKRTLTRLNLT